jgi:hypothetical protein
VTLFAKPFARACVVSHCSLVTRPALPPTLVSRRLLATQHSPPLQWESPPYSPAAMSIMSYNGASIIAMTGDGCVAIASDLRFGVQNQTNACDMPKVFKVHDHLFVGLAGLATDMQTLCVHLARCSSRCLLASGAPRRCLEWSPNKSHAFPSPQASALQVPTQPLQAARGAQHEAQHVRALRVVTAV